MGSLLLSLIVAALGILLSPLAVLAVIAVLLSQRARVNSLAFLAGRVTGITIAVAGGYLVLQALGVHSRPAQGPWLGALHFLLAAVLLVGAGYVMLRGQQRVRGMAAARGPADVAEAAPQLPGRLEWVDHFTPGPTPAMGLGLFLLNPIDLSCAIVGALTIVLSDTSTATQIVLTALFIVVASMSVLVPVLTLQIQREAATGSLQHAGLHRREPSRVQSFAASVRRQRFVSIVVRVTRGSRRRSWSR